MSKPAKAKVDPQSRAVQRGQPGGAFRVIQQGLRFLRKKWFKLAFFAFLFIAVIMLVDAGFSTMYDYWDVGSNSWFDRLRGDGEQFQRGAAIVPQDQFGDQFSTVKYLKQGWKPSESMWFYNTTQGSDLLPYDFFIALEKSGTSEPFRSNENMNFYRYLPQKPTRSNPDGLPVGFVKDKYKSKAYLGFTCAACHTGQLNYKGTGIRIDGAPAGGDMESFLEELSRALNDTLNNKDALGRFAKKVMTRGNFDSEQDVAAELKNSCYRISAYNLINHRRGGTKYGYFRLDAFGRIYNRVLEHVLNPQQLKAVLEGLVRDGKITKAELDAILTDKDMGNLLTGTQRDEIIERLGQLSPKIQLKLRDQIFNAPNAPVSYPFLWDIPQHDYVQWNGLAANAGLGPIGRNAGEVIGVFATLDWAEKKGFSVSAVVSGQGFGDHVNFRSSIKVHNLRRMENQLRSLQSPKWPEDIMPPLNKERMARGETLFANRCAGCHTKIVRDDPDRRVVAYMSKLSEIGTDPRMAENGINDRGLSGILRNQYVNAGPGQVLINEQAPVAALLTKATLSVVATPDENKNFFRRWWDWIYELASETFSNEIKSSLKSGNYDPDTTAEPYKSLLSYKARSLNGIWATAPYLHNGSVPTLYDLLLPEKRQPGDPDNMEYRPPEFQVGSREFDPDKVGLKSSGYNGYTFKTNFPSNSNAGHEYSTRDIKSRDGKVIEPALTKEDRLDLVEYLKSL